jgi:hypothetical protein
MRTHASQLTASMVLSAWLLMLACDAVAQTEVTKPLFINRQPAAAAAVAPRAVEFDRLSISVAHWTAATQGSQGGQSRDSLKNGIIIGAIVGAVALGAFGAVLCNALQEPADPSCLPDTLRIAAVGAAIGAGAGLALDAALTRHGGVSVSAAIRF